MKIEHGIADLPYRYWLVSVEKNEFVMASGKKLPYSAWIGVVREHHLKNGFTIEVWTPAASTPEGYRAAVRVLLTRAKLEIEKSNGNQG